MKKWLIVLSALFIGFTSCSKDDEFPPPIPKPYTYSIRYDVQTFDGLTVNLAIFEYNDNGEKIHHNIINNCRRGTQKSFAANDKTTKVKVYITVESNNATKSFWIQQVYYLNKDSENRITINDTTMTGTSEP